ncbi:DUF6777 domain-containing protein [Streptomyces sp. NPDC051940]|uniref:DUF6777 domain-containing protein n=1 Tax=Streptomyces sp. NPDC051940 TaxID=3155675 RepID=UPI0034167228
MLATIAAGAAVVALVLVFSLGGGGGGGGGEVFMQAANAQGQDPFTPSTTTESGESSVPTTAPDTQTGDSDRVRTVDGAADGLYGGTAQQASCDVEKQVGFLTANKDKQRAFAGVLGLQQEQVPAYLRSLTPVQLRADTRVTNHGYQNGQATSYQAILQAGTAVLVDARGVPRVRCACGNPLTPPVAVEGTTQRQGKEWSGFKSSNVVAVAPAQQELDSIVMFDPRLLEWFKRVIGDLLAEHDKNVPPPPGATASPSPSGSTSESPSETPSESLTPSPSASTPPTGTPTTEAPPTGEPTTEEASPAPPTEASLPAPPTEQSLSGPPESPAGGTNP